MIDEVLETIKKEADDFLKLKLNDSNRQFVHLAPVVDLAGRAPITENAIFMSLIRLENACNNRSINVEHKKSGDQIAYTYAPVKMNLYLLFSTAYADAQEANYKEALKLLSLVISFFQSKPVFTSSDIPALAPNQEKIYMELYNMPEQHLPWNMPGAVYRPSVLYRLRQVMLSEDRIIRVTGTVKEVVVEAADMK